LDNAALLSTFTWPKLLLEVVVVVLAVVEGVVVA